MIDSNKFLIDGMLSGTGIRDALNGGYCDPEEVGLSEGLRRRLAKWLSEYENMHYFNYEDKEKVAQLDAEGMAIARLAKAELKGVEVGYYSDALLRRLQL